jgi:hypothetical protein
LYSYEHSVDLLFKIHIFYWFEPVLYLDSVSKFQYGAGHMKPSVIQ